MHRFLFPPTLGWLLPVSGHVTRWRHIVAFVLSYNRWINHADTAVREFPHPSAAPWCMIASSLLSPIRRRSPELSWPTIVLFRCRLLVALNDHLMTTVIIPSLRLYRGKPPTICSIFHILAILTVVDTWETTQYTIDTSRHGEEGHLPKYPPW